MTSRASSVAVDTSYSYTSSHQDTRSRVTVPNNHPPPKRWSSACEYSIPMPETRPRTRTPGVPTYTDALIRCSQRLRERSLSPPPEVVHHKVSPYQCNMDYYRGKVKSVYEKEPYFKDFVRNIPLSESNVYDTHNLSRLKRRFNSIVSDRWNPGRDTTPDPLKPSRNASEIYEPVSERLAMKHRSAPHMASPLPCIYVYHRSTYTRP